MFGGPAGGLADGVLLMEVQLDDERVNRLTEAGATFVLIGRTRDPSRLTYIDIDFDRTIAAAVSRLAELGHANLALVLQEFDLPMLAGYAPPVRAEAAFSQAVSQCGLSGNVFRCLGDPDAGRSLAAAILRTAPETTGVIVMNEDVSFGLISGFNSLGKQVPPDLSMISIATSDRMGTISDPILTRFVSPGEMLGRAASQALVDRLEGVETGPVQLLIDCELHPGASTAPVRIRAQPC